MKNNLQKAFIAILMCGCSLFASANDIYVSASGNDSNNGSSAAQAFASFSKALGAVTAGGTIHVLDMINMTEDPWNTEETNYCKHGFAPDKSITIQGASRETSGFIGSLDYDATRFFEINEGVTLILKNLTLTKAVYPDKGSAIHVNGGELLGENLIFSENEAENYVSDGSAGGAIQCDATSGIILKNCLFYKNRATKGGAFYMQDTQKSWAEVRFESCSFIENEATSSNAGAAMFFRLSELSQNNSVYIINCTVAKNKAASNGGSVNLYSGKEGDTYSIINCTITDNTNTSVDGGSGVMINSPQNAAFGDVHIQNCIIEGNSVNTDGTPFSADITCGNEAAAAKLQISNSFIGNCAAWGGITIPAECYAASSEYYNYMPARTNPFDPSTMKVISFDDFNTEYMVYPLQEGSLALTYGKASFLDGAGVFTDAINRIRSFDNDKCSAGAMEGVGLEGNFLNIRSTQLSGIQVYPENNQLVVNNEAAKSLELFSISGQLIAKKLGNAEKLSIPVDNLQGVYIARVVTDGQVYSQKVVIK